MTDNGATTAVAEVPAKHAPGEVIDVSGTMVVLTWVTFILAALILYRLAWKPIMAALDKREGDIRQSLADADGARKEAARVNEETKLMLSKAQEEARTIVDGARKAAQQVAAAIEDKANKEGRDLVKSAEREISFAQEKAINALRKQSAQLAVDLASQVVRKDISSADKKVLLDRLLQEL